MQVTKNRNTNTLIKSRSEDRVIQSDLSLLWKVTQAIFKT